jgi:hypothetical protein
VHDFLLLFLFFIFSFGYLTPKFRVLVSSRSDRDDVSPYRITNRYGTSPYQSVRRGDGFNLYIVYNIRRQRYPIQELGLPLFCYCVTVVVLVAFEHLLFIQ